MSLQGSVPTSTDDRKPPQEPTPRSLPLNPGDNWQQWNLLLPKAVSGNYVLNGFKQLNV